MSKQTTGPDELRQFPRVRWVLTAGRWILTWLGGGDIVRLAAAWEADRAALDAANASREKADAEDELLRREILKLTGALEECRAALHGCRQRIGDISGIGHAMELADAAMNGQAAGGEATK